jgi:hypothetical protein
MIRSALALFAAVMVAAPSAPIIQCKPVPVVKQTPKIAPNSTYVSSTEPPRRFARPPKGYVKTVFGRQNIDEFCGRPPCGNVFLGCTRGDLLVLPDPFTTSDEEFARVARHELGHFNGWPATHGD